MHAVAIERVARMLAHHACVAATRALWPLRPRVAREKTVSAGAGSAITWACACGVHAACMQRVHAVCMHMQCACSAHAVCMQCACSAHAVHMQCACSAHAVHTQCTCSVHACSEHRRVGSTIARGSAIARCCALRCTRRLHRRMPQQWIVTAFLRGDESLTAAEGGARWRQHRHRLALPAIVSIAIVSITALPPCPPCEAARGKA